MFFFLVLRLQWPVPMYFFHTVSNRYMCILVWKKNWGVGDVMTDTNFWIKFFFGCWGCNGRHHVFRELNFFFEILGHWWSASTLSDINFFFFCVWVLDGWNSLSLYRECFGLWYCHWTGKKLLRVPSKWECLGVYHQMGIPYLGVYHQMGVM